MLSAHTQVLHSLKML